MKITDIDLYGYDLYVISYSEVNDSSQVPAEQFNMKFGGTGTPKMDLLVKDMSLMSRIRTSNEPAVKDAYEQLLTVMALTNTQTQKK